MVNGELERTTDFLGLLKLLHGYSDFHQYTKKEQRDFIKQSIKNGNVYIDANITCKIINAR